MSRRSWDTYRKQYRSQEMAVLADWIRTGQSGCVVGLAGAGRSNMLGFLCHRPDALQAYLPASVKTVVVPVDLSDLPAYNAATLYRVILRSFYEIIDKLDAPLQPKVTELYQIVRAEQDPFVSQSSLRELLLFLQDQEIGVTLVLDHFDDFCQLATPQMINTIRGLRDSFKDTLSFIVGLRQEIGYLPDPADFGRLYSLLDRNTCWIGPMAEDDARQVIRQEVETSTSIDEEDIGQLLKLSGRNPALLQQACHWWLARQSKLALNDWLPLLLQDPGIQHRLQDIWQKLTQEEQSVLREIEKLQDLRKPPAKALNELRTTHSAVIDRLLAKGVCQTTDHSLFVGSQLISAYIGQLRDVGRGKIWLDEKSGELYQGKMLISGLSPLATTVLRFLVDNPRVRHPKTDLIIQTWPDELRQEGVTDDSLYQVIMEIRKKIEPESAKPRYLVTRRGKPEGGYQFFPEGKPG